MPQMLGQGDPMGQLSSALIHAVWAAPFPAVTGSLEVVWIEYQDGRWTVRHTDARGEHDIRTFVSTPTKEDALAKASGFLRDACLLRPEEIDLLIELAGCSARL